MGLDTTMAESALDAGLGPHRRTGKVALIVLCGGVRDLRFTLTMRESTIGRHAQSTICIPNDDVSRDHAKITRDVDGIAKIVDLDSTNGTFVNHHRIDVEVLREGDRIQVGRQACIDVRYGYTDVRAGIHAHIPMINDAAQDELSEARAELARLRMNIAVRKEHFGDDHPSVAALLHDMARCHQTLGELDTAYGLYENAIEIYGNAQDPCPERAHTLIAQGECRLLQDSVKLAIRPLRTGIELLESRRASELELATGRFVLARTMKALDLSHDQAVEYATLSRQGFADGAEMTRSQFIQVDRWIRKIETANDTRVSPQPTRGAKMAIKMTNPHR